MVSAAVRSEWVRSGSGKRDRSVSRGPDGERVGVVGQDGPLSPDLLALVALQPAAVDAVAAFEVADPSFGAGSVALQPASGASGPGLLAARDEHAVGFERLERLVGRAGHEAAVERDLPRSDPKPLELGDGRRQERMLARVADLRGRGQDQAPRSTSGVLGHFRELGDVAELVRLAELALADRPASGSNSDTIRSVIGSPATRLVICWATFSQRSASSSSAAAARSLACAPRPRARRRARAASFLASLTDFLSSSPVSP